MVEQSSYFLWALRALLILWLLFIAYASLVPFNFTWDAFSTQAFWAFLDPNPFRPRAGRASLAFDAGLNLILFLPLGFALWFHNLRAPIRHLSLKPLFLIAFGYGVVLQFLQLYLPRRTASLSDAAWNAAGLVVGIALAWLFWKIGEEVMANRARHPVM